MLQREAGKEDPTDSRITGIWLAFSISPLPARGANRRQAKPLEEERARKIEGTQGTKIGRASCRKIQREAGKEDPTDSRITGIWLAFSISPLPARGANRRQAKPLEEERARKIEGTQGTIR